MKTVLIADDNPAGRELISSILQSCGYLVLEASDGIDALRLARGHHPDFIILDLHMPGLTGLEVVAELRRRTRIRSHARRRSHRQRHDRRP